MRADVRFFALREASIRRSRCGNSEAIVGVVVTINALYLAYKSVGHLKQLSACDCAFANNLNIALSRRVVKIIAFTLTLKFRTRHCIVATSDRGCGWETSFYQTTLPDGKRASGVRNDAIPCHETIQKLPIYLLSNLTTQGELI